MKIKKRTRSFYDTADEIIFKKSVKVIQGLFGG